MTEITKRHLPAKNHEMAGEIIGTDAELKCVLREIANQTWIALDTEFLREKTYYPLLCLIQVSCGSQTFCIDTIAVNDLGVFNEFLRQHQPQVIIHSMRQDIEALDTAQITLNANVFDSQIAAAFCGFGGQASYANLVKDICNIDLEKSQTRANWSRRPLTAAQLQYAVEDVLYLGEIRDFLAEKLRISGRYEWFIEECEKVITSMDHKILPDQGWKKLKGGGRLPPKHHNLAKRLANWHEEKAQNSNIPREWILPSQVLLDISSHRPLSTLELESINGINPSIIRKFSDEILPIVEQANRETSSTLWWDRRSMLNSEQKKWVKHAMGLIAQVSQDQGISTSLIANRSEVEAFACDKSIGPLTHGWRWELVGSKLS